MNRIIYPTPEGGVAAESVELALKYAPSPFELNTIS
jgi:hypothetical protein